MGEDELRGDDGVIGTRHTLNRADILQTALRVRLEDDARARRRCDGSRPSST